MAVAGAMEQTIQGPESQDASHKTVCKELFKQDLHSGTIS